MSDFIKDMSKIKDKFKVEKNKIQDKIETLKKELDNISEEESVEVLNYGKSINLKDVDMYGRDFNYFPELVNGYVLENGISKENINEHDLNIIVHGYSLSNNKEKYAKKIKESFFNNLDEKERFQLATFFPKYIFYKDLLIGDFPLSDSKDFSWINEYFYENYSFLLFRGFTNYSGISEFEQAVENCIFSGVGRDLVINEPVINYTEDIRKYTFVCLNNKALEDINKTKFLVNKIKEFGYDFKFKIHLKFGDKLTNDDLRLLTE